MSSNACTFGWNKFEKHETKYQFSKPKEGFLKQETGYPYTLEAKNPISLDSNQPEDYSYKSSTPLSKKYESLETKGSFDRLNYLPSQEKPKNRLEIPKAPLRKEGNFENIEKNYSPRTKKEDSFRSWDKPNEMAWSCVRWTCLSACATLGTSKLRGRDFSAWGP